MTAWLVTAAFPQFLHGRHRYTVVLASPTGKACRHTDTPSLHEAWRLVREHPHHPNLTVRLPQEGETP